MASRGTRGIVGKATSLLRGGASGGRSARAGTARRGSARGAPSTKAGLAGRALGAVRGAMRR